MLGSLSAEPSICAKSGIQTQTLFPQITMHFIKMQQNKVKMNKVIMSCRGSGRHLSVYIIFPNPNSAVNHLRCCWGWHSSTAQWRGQCASNRGCTSLHFALTFDFNAWFSPLRHGCRCYLLCCTCSSSSALACQSLKKQPKCMCSLWASVKPLSSHKMGKKDIKNDLNLTSQFVSQ